MALAWAKLDVGTQHFFKSAKDGLKEIAMRTDESKAANDAQEYLHGMKDKEVG